MRGFPKYLNSKQDYLNCLADFEQETKAELQRLLDSRFIWVDTAILETEESGQTDDTHRIVKAEDEFIQQELIEDANSELVRLGFTVEEVEGLING